MSLRQRVTELGSEPRHSVLCSCHITCCFSPPPTPVPPFPRRCLHVTCVVQTKGNQPSSGGGQLGDPGPWPRVCGGVYGGLGAHVDPAGSGR